MDIATIIGLIGGALIVWQAVGGSCIGLYDGTALLVVAGGGIAATLVAFPLRDFWQAIKATKNVLVVRPLDPPQLIERMVGYAETARRDGILALEQPIAAEPSSLVRAGVRLAVDGTEPALIMDILETELRFVKERHLRVQRLLERLGRHWVLFGGVGALLVLAQGGHVAAMALPLLYGALLYGLVGGAFARKLGEYHEKETLFWCLVIEAIMAIQSGDNPRIVEHKLSVFLAPKDRPSGDRKPTAPPPAPTPDISPDQLQAFVDEQRGRVLELVREAVRKSAGDKEQKKAVEARATRFEKGELGMVEFLAGLGGELYTQAVDCLQNPPKSLTDRVVPSDRVLDFEGLAELTDEAIERSMREIDQRDLVIALKGASSAVREKFLGNMSDRVRGFISEEIDYARCEPGRILDSQARIVMQLYKMAEQGKIQL